MGCTDCLSLAAEPACHGFLTRLTPIYLYAVVTKWRTCNMLSAEESNVLEGLSAVVLLQRRNLNLGITAVKLHLLSADPLFGNCILPLDVVIFTHTHSLQQHMYELHVICTLWLHQMKPMQSLVFHTIGRYRSLWNGRNFQISCVELLPFFPKELNRMWSVCDCHPEMVCYINS